MKKGIRFHSIYYRWILFIFIFTTMVIYFIGEGKDMYFEGHLFNSKKLCIILNIAWLVMFVVFSFVVTKCVISKDGIYLKKIDLTVPWEDISNITYTWINEFSLYQHECSFYNVKTMVIYRHDIVFPVLTTLFNVVLNVGVLYIGYTTKLLTIKVKPELFLTLLVLYGIKSIIFPIVMLKITNMKYGNYLRHENLSKGRNPNVIHV